MVVVKMKQKETTEVQARGGKLLQNSLFKEAASNGMTTAVTDRQVLEAILADIENNVEKASRLLSPYDLHMASFHIDLLKREFLKAKANGEPSANVMMMSGTWLQNRVPGLAVSVIRLWLSSAAIDTISRAGYSLEFWVNARLSNFQVEGMWCNLKVIKDTMLAAVTEDQLANWCETLGFVYADLHGADIYQKTQELLALCVRYGRVQRLDALLKGKQMRAVA